jgi:hypothetical protein
MNVKQLAAHMVKDVNNYFVDFQQYKDKYSIHNNNMFNFDKSGFLISVTTSKCVIVLINYTIVY